MTDSSRIKRVSPQRRIAALVLEHGHPSDECWAWTGHLDPDGYGRTTGGRAHRYSYEFFVGPIPEGMEIDHACHDSKTCQPPCLHRSCVNPAHLRPVTHAENSRRMVFAQTLKSHCPQGHEYSPENTYEHKGHRQCRICVRERSRAYRARKARLA